METLNAVWQSGKPGGICILFTTRRGVFEKWLRVKIDDNDRKATVTLLGKFSFPDLADGFPGSISRFRCGSKEIRVSVYLLLFCVLQLCFLFRKVGCLSSRHELRFTQETTFVFQCCQFSLFSSVIHFSILMKTETFSGQCQRKVLLTHVWN